MKPSGGRFNGVIIHHSATEDGKTKSWESIRHYHTQVKGWNEIGYHFGIENIGGTPLILSGRGLEWEGAHCRGFNGTIGICIVGNYDNRALEIEKFCLLLRLLSGLLVIFPELSLDQVRYHNEFSNKTCPGSMFVKRDFLLSVLK